MRASLKYKGNEKAAHSILSGPLLSSVLALCQAYQRLLERLDDWRCCWKQSEQ